MAEKYSGVATWIDDKTYEVHLVNMTTWQITNVQTVRLSDDGALVCDCGLFRYENKCWHVVFNKSDDFGKDSVGVCKDVAAEKVEFVDPDVAGNVSVVDLIAGIHDVGVLNPTRIRSELEEAYKNNKSLKSDSIGELGATFESGKSSLDYEDVGDIFEGASLTPEEDEEGKEEEKKPEAPALRTNWKSIPMPNPNEFYVERDVWKSLCWAVEARENFLLTGPSGSGKSELIYVLSRIMKKDMEVFNMGAMSEPRLSLIGTTHLDKAKGTWFNESRFVRQIKKPNAILMLDEITRCVKDAYNILLPLMDRQGYLALDESEDAAIVHKADGVVFGATANIGMEYTGTEAMDKALRERCGVIVDMEFPPPDNEIVLLQHRCAPLNKGDAVRLVKLATKQREIALTGEFEELISTRMLMVAGQMIRDGHKFSNACMFSIENVFKPEGGDLSERTKIRQLIQKG